MNRPKSLLLRNARIVATDRTVVDRDVLIESDIITRIWASGSIESGADVTIDLSGCTLFPGFIDVHIHGAAGVDTLNASAADLRRVGEFLARQGVTAWLPTLVPAAEEQYRQATESITALINAQGTDSDSATKCARVLGVHYEGPFVNSEQCGALHREHFRVFKSRAELDTLPTIKSDGAVHMMTLAPEVEHGIDLINELNKRNWIVSIGHTRATRDVLDQARNAGARHVTHFMNAMTPLHHRDLGAVGWGLIHDDVTIDVIADGIHLDREVLKLIVKSKGLQRVSIISDSIAAAGKGDGEYEIWGEKITVTNGRTSNTRGSIAGSVITMLDAVRMMLSLGFSESEVARMSSLNPAQLLGIDGKCGSIEEGKGADLVALDASQNVMLTIIGGNLAHRK